MSKYLIRASYSPEGIKGVMAKGGSARVEAIEKMVSAVGGSVEAVYFAFGSDDIVLIVEAPNNAAVAAVAGAVGGTGAVSKYETVVLLAPTELDDAANMSVEYTPPGAEQSK
jgi:uncharacterized protein with GYD domain